MQAHLAATDLACRRGERLLFRGVSLDLGPGAACRVAGPNGIGKTSLIRILAGLLRPFAGTVERRGAIALLDERHALDPQLPLGRALAFWARLDGASAREHIRRLGLEKLEDVPVRYLSTGQKKRAALARLIAQDAPIWLLDEPLNGLDRQGLALCETLVAEHCAAGGIALVASHQEMAAPAMTTLALADFAP
ncbi:heme ABC exporter ATP-binding protein CcmA [Pelagerythrobacter marensis]|uniref:Heme ABC exporter ATP-binding protein CcmA n=1 Tax=Pelagerythrobacter marensis TaxID=543877 RepID=A0ABZ2CYZ7_9SPHN